MRATIKPQSDRTRMLPLNVKLVAIAMLTLLACVIAFIVWSSSGGTSGGRHAGNSLDSDGARLLTECAAALGSFPRRPPALTYVPERYCEGYWRASAANDAALLPFPQPFAGDASGTYCGKRRLLAMLERLESAARSGTHGLRVERSRGLSPSRLEPDKLLGNVEFVDGGAGGACWTGDLRAYYMAQHNVAPSIEFVHYVVNAHDRLLPSA